MVRSWILFTYMYKSLKSQIALSLKIPAVTQIAGSC